MPVHDCTQNPVSNDPTVDCPDLDPATERCLHPDCATPDPPPEPHAEHVSVSTLWIGPGKLDVIRKRVGWASGLYGFGNLAADGTADYLGWFRCVSAPDGTPATFEDAGIGNDIALRPLLTYRANQTRAHGILRARGNLTAITLIVRNGSQEVRYEWDGQELNAEREYVLRRMEGNKPGAALARACPATRAVWIDEPHPQGAEVHAEYTVVPLPDEADINDVTDAIQDILNNGKNVVLPPGTYYVRTHYDGPLGSTTTGLKIPAGLYIRGRAPSTGESDRDVLDGSPILRARPGLHSDEIKGEPPLTLGTMIERSESNNTTAQQGAGLKWLTVYGALDGIDLFALTEQPSKSHHGALFSGVNRIYCQGVRFTRCFDDGLKLDRLKYKELQPPVDLVVTNGGQTFAVPDTSAPNDGPPILEGLVKITQDPNTNLPEFRITIPAGAPFGNETNPKPLAQDLTLYSANATRPRAGLAPIGFLTDPSVSKDPNYQRFGPPLNAYVQGDDSEPAYAQAIGWLDILNGTGYFCDGWRLPTGTDLPAGTAVRVDYTAARIVSNDTPSLESCDFDRNGRNGYTHANNIRAGYFVLLRVRGNGRLEASIGLEGAVAADLQLGTTARNDFEIWEELTVRDLIVEGTRSSAFKIGAEPGPEYPVGPAIYTGVTLHSCARRGIKTAGQECGPLEFEDLEVTECGEVAMSIGHGSGTFASDLRFGNRKQAADPPPSPGDLCTPDFDEEQSTADLLLANDAYVPAKYYDAAPPVRHEFRNIQGILPDQQAYVKIGAPGVIVRGATNVHFAVRTGGSAPLPPCTSDPRPEPPVELWGPFVDCTFDLEPGTLFDGVPDGGPTCSGASEA